LRSRATASNYRAALFLPLHPQPSPHELVLMRFVGRMEEIRSQPRRPTYAKAQTSAIPAAIICQSNFIF
jgi:hypothetical protein